TWYDALTGGNLITDPSLSNIGSSTYYAETTNDLTGCLSLKRTSVTLEIIATPQAPTAEAEQTFCNASTVADLIAQGDNLLWYSEPQGGAAINPATYLINGNVYYASQTVNGCESLARTGVQIFIDAPEPPQGQAQQIFCNEGALADIELTSTDIIWYPLAQGGDPLPLNHPLENGATYYAAQQIDGCESVLRLAVNIILQQPEPPIAEPEQTTCDLARIRDLEIEGENIIWYDSPFGGQSLSEETLLTQNSIYYASQTINGCESPERTAVQVNLFTCTLKIYNAISANGNGQNDFLIIENIEFYPINSLEIYSRDGDLVYTHNAYGTSGDIFRGFANVDGVFGPDNPLPTGTYMYVFTYLDPFREESNTLKGFLTLNSN
ncbi:gliding motility-associated C-terminal domain-containing protein, partial [Flavobacteriaceae bacterium]|nr:gliding motility-associated C-terminal domain-containing protein [Flavobacteriaceae bacterium]